MLEDIIGALDLVFAGKISFGPLLEFCVAPLWGPSPG